MRKGLTSAILVFVFGFGTMSLMWHFGYKDQVGSLRGLYSYLAAAFGDSVCLPILVGSAVAYIMKSAPLTRIQKRKSYLVGIVLGLIAAAEQARWLISDSTLLNWTIPKIHYFNFAGWYHAVFFVIMVAAIGIALSQIWMIRRIVPEEDDTKALLMALIILSSSSFLTFLSIDNYSSLSGNQPVYGVFILSNIVFGLFFSSSSLNKSYTWIRCQAYGTITPLIIGLFIKLPSVTPDSHGNSYIYFINLISCILFSASFISPKPKSLIEMASCFILLSIPTFFTVLLIPVSESCGFYIAIICIVADIAIARDKHSRENRYYHSYIPVVFLFVSFLNISINSTKGFLNVSNTTQDVYNVLLFVVLGLFCNKYVVRIFQIVLVAEDNEAKGLISKYDYSCVQKTVYSLLSSTALASFSFLVVALYHMSGAVGCNSDNKEPFFDSNIEYMALAIGVIAMPLIFTWGFAKFVKHRRAKPVSFIVCILCALSFTCLIYLVYHHRKPWVDEWWMIIFIFPIIGTSLFTANGFYSNLITIRGRDKNTEVFILSLIILFGSLLVSSCSILPLQKNCSAIEFSVYSVVGLCGIVLAYMIIPISFACLYSSDQENSIYHNNDFSGLLQDCFIATILATFVGIIPSYYSYKNNEVSTFLGITMICITVAWIYAFALEQNVKHLKSMEKIKDGLIEREPANRQIFESQYRELIGHVKRQNCFALFSLLPYSVVYFVQLFLQSEEDDGVAFWRIMNRLMPTQKGNGS